jgi:hypothetical protein
MTAASTATLSRWLLVEQTDGTWLIARGRRGRERTYQGSYASQQAARRAVPKDAEVWVQEVDGYLRRVKR